MALPTAAVFIPKFTRTGWAASAAYPVARARVLFGIAAAFLLRGTRQDVYNILWAVVFGFATLNILSLAAKRYEPSRRGLTFGELMAVSVVVVSLFLLGWEMLNLFHVFPIKLKR
jgi:ABC-type Mn2+/Zn2+ transport system permease subunit